MSFKQRRRNGLFRVSWSMCLLLSVLAHLFLLAGSYLVPEEWLPSPRPAEAARRQVVVSARMVKKVEPHPEGRRQAPKEHLPAIVKTSEEQESATRPEAPDPRATGTRVRKAAARIRTAAGTCLPRRAWSARMGRLSFLTRIGRMAT
ncbi:hypothetical protein ABFY27_09690 [Akkermansia massiliensis]